MAEEKENGPKEEKGATTTTTTSVFFWFAYFSFTAFLVLVAAAFFQMQLVSIRRELATLRLNLTVCEEGKLRNLKKRSSSEKDQEEEDQGIQAAHLRGTNPFQKIEKQGKIGPWTASSTDTAFISLKKKNTEVEIGQSGIYYVYAQVYYLTSEPHNSFQILSYRGTEERRQQKQQQQHRRVATCACQGRSSLGEVSCYAGHTGSFRSGERLYLNQIEQNRLIHLGDGYTYFGVVLLRRNATMSRSRRRSPSGLSPL